MKEREPPPSVFVQKGEGGGVHAVAHPESTGDAFDQLSFARAEIASQANDRAGWRFASPLLAELQCFFRTPGNERSHEQPAA